MQWKEAWLAVTAYWSSLSATDQIQVFVAVGTGLAAIFAAASALYAGRSSRLLREELRAQTFLDVIEYERDIHFSTHMDTIRAR